MMWHVENAIPIDGAKHSVPKKWLPTANRLLSCTINYTWGLTREPAAADLLDGEQVPEQAQGLHEHADIRVGEQPEDLVSAQGGQDLGLDLLVRLEGHVHQGPAAVEPQGRLVSPRQPAQQLHRAALQDGLQAGTVLGPVSPLSRLTLIFTEQQKASTAGGQGEVGHYVLSPVARAVSPDSRT